MQQALTETDIMFRIFQIRKFNKKNMVPAVTMTVNINVTQILKLKDELNSRERKAPHITITHIIAKAVADTLVQFPVLYSFFNGKKIVENKELVLNIPVDFESHVEYIIIRNPDMKSIDDIATEFHEELSLIQLGKGTYKQFLVHMNTLPIFQKIKYFCGQEGKMRFLREHYGIFPISNLGSFHMSSGTIAISQPMIAALCFGAIEKNQEGSFLSLTLTFDHRPLDGAYAGKFLYNVKTLLESPNSIIPIR